MSHIHGKPMHPQTQSKIERWYRSMKNTVKLENCYLPRGLISRLEEYVEYNNNNNNDITNLYKN